MTESRRTPLGIIALYALIVSLFGCNPRDAVTRLLGSMSSTSMADSMGVLPTRVTEVPTDEPPDLVESSTLVITAAQPDIAFTINDSGSDPVLFALDTSGRTRGRWKVNNAKNRDWEAASSGPCIPSAGVLTATRESCLYVADVGDNSARRAFVSIYQFREPVIGAGIVDSSVDAKVVHLRYPDQPHDVEAMYVGPDGTAYLITKRALKNAAGQLRPSLVFAVPSTAWESRDTVIASLDDSLPITPGSAPNRQITDASLSTDSKLLAVRTYGQIFTFSTDSVTGRTLRGATSAICNIVKVEGRHGEGVAWLSGNKELLLSHEGNNAPMYRVTCPTPLR